MRFSERHGYRLVRQVMQIECMDDVLTKRLWNCLHASYLEPVRGEWLYQLDPSEQAFWYRLWHEHFKEPADQMPRTGSELGDEMRRHFFACEWYDVYDLLEFFGRNGPVTLRNNEFRAGCNTVMEEELAGYRFVAAQVTPITSPDEVEAIEDALGAAGVHPGVRNHLASALAMLSDRQEPDYRNSIKESISAVEALCRQVTGDPKATLGDALRKMRNELKIPLHTAVYAAFEKLYGYTSDEDGIRHAMTDEPNVSFSDAKFMLVACSAFVNYVLGKMAEAGAQLPGAS